MAIVDNLIAELEKTFIKAEESAAVVGASSSTAEEKVNARNTLLKIAQKLKTYDNQLVLEKSRTAFSHSQARINEAESLYRRLSVKTYLALL